MPRNQGKSQGLQPQKRNQTSFSSTYQPHPASNKKATAATFKRRTQAQEAMAKAGFNPMEQLIGISAQYTEMISKGVNWRGGDASEKEIASYVKELTNINLQLSRYFSSAAPVETVAANDGNVIEQGEVVDNTKPLSPQELMKARRNMITRLDDKL